MSVVDKLIIQFDRALHTLVPAASTASQPSPAADHAETELDDAQRRRVAGLMRVNHTGEVCAQALYQGQALTARLEDVQTEMETAAREEVDHLAWCEQRLEELGSRTSLLNPLFYAASFSLGAAAGLTGDGWSLGFVAATEDQVCRHLRAHLEQLPGDDHRSRAVLEKMLEDEARHGSQALASGGRPFSPVMKSLMTAASKVMTGTTYYI